MSNNINEDAELANLRKQFNEKYGSLTDSEIQREILFTQKLLHIKSEKIRFNTSVLVWFLIVIPIILTVLLVFIADN